jgi:hypothetical protein
MSNVYVLRWDNPDKEHAVIHCIYATLEDAKQATIAKNFVTDMGWCHTSYGWIIEEWSIGFLKQNTTWCLTAAGWGKMLT